MRGVKILNIRLSQKPQEETATLGAGVCQITFMEKSILTGMFALIYALRCRRVSALAKKVSSETWREANDEGAGTSAFGYMPAPVVYSCS